MGGRCRWIPGAHWTASLASLVNFQPMRRLVLKKTEHGTEQHPRQSSDLHMHVHMCTFTSLLACTQTQTLNKHTHPTPCPQAYVQRETETKTHREIEKERDRQRQRQRECLAHLDSHLEILELSRVKVWIRKETDYSPEDFFQVWRSESLSCKYPIKKNVSIKMCYSICNRCWELREFLNSENPKNIL